MKTGVLLSVLAAVTVVCAHDGLPGPTHGNPTRAWASYGEGLGLLLAAGEVSASFQTGHRLFTARCAATGFGAVDMGWVVMSDYGFLYGVSTADRYTNASASVGLSYVSGQLGDRRVRTVGIPLEANFTVIPCAYFGLGAGVFGNLNFTLPFCGGVVFLRLGKLR
ncbi:MAG TPA: hypothetical protein VMH22_02910 [bacterium]|nr:hypothetical protein [bacterium]